MRAAAASDVFHAIADPHRRALLDAVAAEELPVGELTRVTGLSYSAVSQHLAVLRNVGLVERRKQGKQRLYRLEAAPLAGATHWLEHYRRFWQTSLGNLKQHLERK